MTPTPKRRPSLADLELLAVYAPALEGRASGLEPSPGGVSTASHGARPAYLDDSLLWRASLAQARLEELGRVDAVAARVLRYYYATIAPNFRRLPAVGATIYLLSVGKRLPEAPPNPGNRPKHPGERPRKRSHVPGWEQAVRSWEKTSRDWERAHGVWKRYQDEVTAWAGRGDKILTAAERAWEGL